MRRDDMRNLTCLLVVLVIPRALFAASYEKSPRWRLVFRDEFNGASGLPNKCYSQTPNCIYNGLDWAPKPCQASDIHPGLAPLQKCTWAVFGAYNIWSNRDSSFSPRLAEVVSGELVLWNRSASATGGGPPYDCGKLDPMAATTTADCRFVSGGMHSHYHDGSMGSPHTGFHYRYGRFEFRARLPAGPGTFPALWMVPQPVPSDWPADGEIDVMEATASAGVNHVFQTLHDELDYIHSNVGFDYEMGMGNFFRTFVESYHTYAVEWDRAQVRFFVDNREIGTVRDGETLSSTHHEDRGPLSCRIGIPDRPFFMILNAGIHDFSNVNDAAANANPDGFSPQKLKVDFIRAYIPCGDAGPDCVESTLSAFCQNPCQGIGRFDGYNCHLARSPSGPALNPFIAYVTGGKFYYRRKVGVTLPTDCWPGFTFTPSFGCLYMDVPSGRTGFTAQNHFYLTPVCSVTDGLSDCPDPCPFGGSFDSRNCFVMPAPAGSQPLIYQGGYYYAAVTGLEPCPHGGEWDLEKCFLGKAPAGSQPFVYQGGFYLKAVCNNSPDWQFIPPVVAKITRRGGCDHLPAEPLKYQAHMKGKGWLPHVADGQTAGITGQNRRMEAARVQLVAALPGVHVQYRAHVKGKGWLSWVQDGATAGTTGKNKRMEAIQIKLIGAPAGERVMYRAHVQGKGWLPWVFDGATAGTTGQNRRLEAFEAVIVK